jgi:alkaline phosphatase D
VVEPAHEGEDAQREGREGDDGGGPEARVGRAVEPGPEGEAQRDVGDEAEGEGAKGPAAGAAVAELGAQAFDLGLEAGPIIAINVLHEDRAQPYPPKLGRRLSVRYDKSDTPRPIFCRPAPEPLPRAPRSPNATRVPLPRRRAPRAPLACLAAAARTRFACLAAAALGAAACRGLLPPPSPDVARVSALAGRTLSRIALGSCSNPEEPQPIWDAIRRDAPDLYLALGDNIYGDTEDMSLLRAKYWRQEAVPGFAALRRTVPVYGTWDDHDFGANDAGGDYAQKAMSQRLFLDFLREPPDSPRRARRGVYDAVVVGPPGRRVHIVALDLRYHRSALLPGAPGQPYRPNTSPDATMLGAEQWAWLEREFERPAEVRVIASSTQLVNTQGGGEKWANMPRERERFLQALGRAAPAATVIVSGDRHFAEISALARGPAGPPLYELTSSGLTETEEPDARNDLRVGAAYGQVNYGLVDFDWNPPAPALVLRLRDVRGRDVAAKRVPMEPPPPAVLGPP